MARIRSIKPEFWTSEQVADCSTTARLLFVGMWNFCDDGGVHPDSAKRLKMEIFPADNFTFEQVAEFVDELINAGLLHRFSSEGKSYLAVTGWHHQKIDKPSLKYPQPKFDDRSPNGSRMVADDLPAEGSGCREDVDVEGSGEETSCGETAEPSSPPTAPEETPVLEFPCDGTKGMGKVWKLLPSYVAELQAAFPHQDILAECRKAWIWVDAKPDRRKTVKGMKAFLTGWMSRSQNKGSPSRNGTHSSGRTLSEIGPK